DDAVAEGVADLALVPTTPRVTHPASSIATVRRSPGFSIVEVLVALMLVTIGLLAVAGSSALALRTSLDAGRRRHAAHRVASRLSSLEAAGCAGVTSGYAADTALQLTERWTVVVRSPAYVIVADSVTWLGPQGVVHRTLTSALPC
ncbi:MAG: prepilin-type N-terminal cleavage/methylation domain-containing protein, partial [Gemmatimonadaceae bacterium]